MGGAPLSDGGAAGTDSVGGLSVVSTTPKDQAVAVERDGVVEVTFSAVIDQASVTADSFRVEGPLGAVAGKLTVEGDKVTFTPDKPLSILADYAINLSSHIRSLTNAALSEYELEFQTRDGAFSKPVRVSAATAVNFSMTGLVWNNPLGVWASRFE